MEYNDAQDQEQEIALPEPESVVYGQWSAWSAYTPCSNGERTRVRTCLSRKYALKVICHGVSIEDLTLTKYYRKVARTVMVISIYRIGHRKVVFTIPKDYVTDGVVPEKTVNLETIQLEMLHEGEEIKLPFTKIK
ncbi:hypothetical protein WR25_17836 [Diploscapter pachys]|uniref:Uncharacterized protein n=1 Tax=Diploscapter pachys TaxID=2018661 RepID=A0A2A2KYG8_9BILA|nr:hypothetical protein WR25_17836 [Diploscapter pachys]